MVASRRQKTIGFRPQMWISVPADFRLFFLALFPALIGDSVHDREDDNEHKNDSEAKHHERRMVLNVFRDSEQQDEHKEYGDRPPHIFKCLVPIRRPYSESYRPDDDSGAPEQKSRHEHEPDEDVEETYSGEKCGHTLFKVRRPHVILLRTGRAVRRIIRRAAKERVLKDVQNAPYRHHDEEREHSPEEERRRIFLTFIGLPDATCYAEQIYDESGEDQKCRALIEDLYDCSGQLTKRLGCGECNSGRDECERRKCTHQILHRPFTSWVTVPARRVAMTQAPSMRMAPIIT